MCFTVDAQPPTLPDAHRRGSVQSEDIVLVSADQTQFAAYRARPENAATTAVVILPDVRGLFQFYKDLAIRFAEAGILSIVIDYFGRTAGLTARDEDFDYWPHVQQTTTQQVQDDLAAAIAYLHKESGERVLTTYTVGFCFGGTHSFKAAAMHQGLSGVVGFYGNPTKEGFDGSPAPITLVSEFECPVLGLFGGEDQSISAEAIQEFDESLNNANVQHELITYPHAPHSFFDRKQKQFSKESEDAWHRILTFMEG